MATSRDHALAILRQNLGFDDPEQWVDYAVQHSFKRTSATPVPNCPDCGGSPRGQLGQFIYYSTLMRLLTCGSCHLIWADAHLDPLIVSAHFETAYKDRDHFREARSWIFRHLVQEIGRLTPQGGTVLDIGGAQGDLMHLLERQRPDITPVVHDLSENAIRHAGGHFGLPTVRGDISALQAHNSRYDVVVLSDVLYYEPRIADFWRILPRLLVPGGSVVLRVPNKLPIIRAHQVLSRLLRLTGQHGVQDDIRYFNPEHIYILNRRYLTGRLTRLGFTSVQVLPSPPALRGSPRQQVLARILFAAAAVISLLSGRRLTLSPSMLVIGTGFAPQRFPRSRSRLETSEGSHRRRASSARPTVTVSAGGRARAAGDGDLSTRGIAGS